MSATDSDDYKFGDFRVSRQKRMLLLNGDSVALTSKAFDTLLYLLEHRERVVDKSELMQAIWPNTAVEENNLSQNIAALRRAFGENPKECRYIATVPGRGYRFIASVENVSAARDSSSSKITLAVLPFENLSSDPGRDYLADGLTEETSASLGQIDPEHLSVIGRTSVRAYKGTTKTIAEIGKELNAAYLIEGSIRAEGERLRITCKLIRVSSQTQEWSANFESEPSGLLNFQRELSGAIAEQIRLRLSPERLDALSRRQSRNAEAHDLYLRGRQFWNQLKPVTTKRATEYYARATELDPQFALAWSAPADAISASPINGDVCPALAAAPARDSIMRAIHAEPKLLRRRPLSA